MKFCARLSESQGIRDSFVLIKEYIKKLTRKLTPLLFASVITLGTFIPLYLAEDALPINLNTASAVDIVDAIDGVGEVRVAAIILLREELGGFAMLEQLLDVKGISPVALARIRSTIVLE